MVIDSVHNLTEWLVIKASAPLSLLVSVVCPQEVRQIRNGPLDGELDLTRVGYWHSEAPSGCLMAEVDWTFQGTTADTAQISNIETLATWLRSRGP